MGCEKPREIGPVQLELFLLVGRVDGRVELVQLGNTLVVGDLLGVLRALANEAENQLELSVLRRQGLDELHPVPLVDIPLPVVVRREVQQRVRLLGHVRLERRQNRREVRQTQRLLVRIHLRVD